MSAYYDYLMSLGPVALLKGSSDIPPVYTVEGRPGLNVVWYYGSTLATNPPATIRTPELPSDDTLYSIGSNFQITLGSIDTASGISIVCYVNSLTGFTSSNDVFMRYYNNTNQNFFVQRNTNTNNIEYGVYTGDANDRISIGNSIINNVPMHLVITFDYGTNTQKLYKDGVLLHQKNRSGPLPLSPASGPLFDSARYVSNTPQPSSASNSTILYPAIYNKVLTDAEIQEAYSKLTLRTLSGTASLSSGGGVTSVQGHTMDGKLAFNVTPDPITGAWTAQCTQEPVHVSYIGPIGYAPQIHGLY